MPAQYMRVGGHLQEVNWFKERYRSWFLGDSVISYGGLYLSTPVDPLFLALPILEASRRLVRAHALEGLQPVSDHHHACMRGSACHYTVHAQACSMPTTCAS